MIKVIGVRFRQAGKIYYFSPGKLKINRGDHVIVETARGVEYGYVVVGNRDVEDDRVVQPLKPVIRMATEQDDQQAAANKEKEKEVRISYDDVDNFIFIIENVMHFKVVDSYERYRTIFTNEDVEISIDEYPFGIALEIENKSSTKNPEEVVMNYVSKLKLNIKDSYRLSWDDKYVELCKEQNKEIYNEVTFDKDMPSI